MTEVQVARAGEHDDIPIYHTNARGDARYVRTVNDVGPDGAGNVDVEGGSGVTDHGALTGLADDDHPQYHNDARGDVRYKPLAYVPAWTDITGKPSVFPPDTHNHDDRYFTETESDARYSLLAHTHTNIVPLAEDAHAVADLLTDYLDGISEMGISDASAWSAIGFGPGNIITYRSGAYGWQVIYDRWGFHASRVWDVDDDNWLVQTSSDNGWLQYSQLGHGHNAADITSGTLDDARIPLGIARDSEVAAAYVAITDYEDSDVLTKVKNVDGTGSGLDADTLDGVEGSGYTPIAHVGSGGTAHANAVAAGAAGFLTGGDKSKLDGIETGATADQTAAEILTAVKTVDGAASGLDADLLDGNQAAAFVLATDYEDADVLTKVKNVDGTGSGLDADTVDGSHASAFASATGLSDHLADTIDAHDASAVSFVPTGTIAATDVQSAIAEVASEAGGGGGGTSEVEIDFGAFPGATDATVAVSGQTGILLGSIVEAWVKPKATTEHTADEHWVEAIKVAAGNIVAGTGFTIYGRGEDNVRLYGRFNIAWRWA